jgi:hypothetical protein
MATMYENVCSNYMGGIELTFIPFIPLHIDLTISFEKFKPIKKLEYLNFSQ